MFCNKINGSKLQNTPDTPDFWLENKVALQKFYVFSLPHQLSYICFICYRYIFPWFIHL